MLEEFLPEVPIEDQVKVGLGWDRAGAQQERGDRKRLWHTFTLGSRQGDDDTPFAAPVSTNGSGVTNGIKDQNGTHNGPEKKAEEEEEEEEELEEWEIEAEKVFQDSDDDVSPSLPVKAPTSATPPVKAPIVKKASEMVKPIETHSTPSTPRSKVNSPMEQSPAQSPTADQEQFKRRRKMWQRK
jgi:hypothetical protein